MHIFQRLLRFTKYGSVAGNLICSNSTQLKLTLPRLPYSAANLPLFSKPNRLFSTTKDGSKDHYELSALAAHLNEVAEDTITEAPKGSLTDEELKAKLAKEFLELRFTCSVCDTRSTKRFTKLAYLYGVVLVRCPGCDKLHLISDQLCWFGDTPYKIGDIINEAVSSST